MARGVRKGWSVLASTVAAAFSISGGFVAVTYFYRPLPDPGTDTLGGPLRSSFWFTSAHSVADIAVSGRPVPFWLEQCRIIAAFLNVSFFRLCMAVLGGSFQVASDDNYDRFLDAVIHRQPGTALLTVSNHRSMADDPGAMSCIIPYRLGINPKYVRWSLCAQDYCFNEKV
jgi:hypothetical protein